MKQKVSTPIAIVIAVVVLAVIASVGWQLINRDSEGATGVGTNGAKAATTVNSLPPGEVVPATNASAEKAGGNQMLKPNF